MSTVVKSPSSQTATHGIAFKSDATRFAFHEALNQACTLSSKLNALLANTYGEGYEPFNNLSNTNKDSYLWACGDMAHELAEAIERISEIQSGNVEKGGAA